MEGELIWKENLAETGEKELMTELQLSCLVICNTDCCKPGTKKLEYVEIFICNWNKHVNETSRPIQIIFYLKYCFGCSDINIVLIKGNIHV